MTNIELANKCLEIATQYKTLYVMGGFGHPLNKANKDRLIAQQSYNRLHKDSIMSADGNTFGFDCVNLIKGIMWGWDGDKNKTYGGAKIDITVCPDLGANRMIEFCRKVSTDGWSGINVGEAVWTDGHIGVYVGNGLVVEATPRWGNCVQITCLGNIGMQGNHPVRTWKRHGFFPFIEYVDEEDPETIIEPSEQMGTIAIGDIVNFTGSTHYSNAWATTGFRATPGRAKVTHIRSDGLHKYHLIHTVGGGSTVYGWVDAEDIEQEVTQ